MYPTFGRLSLDRWSSWPSTPARAVWRSTAMWVVASCLPFVLLLPCFCIAFVLSCLSCPRLWHVDMIFRQSVNKQFVVQSTDVTPFLCWVFPGERLLLIINRVRVESCYSIKWSSCTSCVCPGLSKELHLFYTYEDEVYICCVSSDYK